MARIAVEQSAVIGEVVSNDFEPEPFYRSDPGTVAL
jgi:hypothetical protein